MAKKVKGSKFHPARISGHQKFLRMKKANEILAEKNNRKRGINPELYVKRKIITI
jgi:hypothetical protein